ncbi:hypothetical protein GCM10010232_49830 [Streptomyces amakusaensis]|uniref:Uncharacterized protein n=1 Tax=Streptomyces amakusaensis TaxID=67271 RepID=A0ABW0AKS9_9ACTN
MSLHAKQFFTSALPHQLDGLVIGEVFYAPAPEPDLGIWLRIDFYETIRQHTYGGLRLTAIHPDKGQIDAVALSFADHCTFRARDLHNGTRPGTSGYATIRDFPHDEEHRPWAGGDFTALADAVHRYARIWGIPIPEHGGRTGPRAAPVAAPSRIRAATARAR